VKPVIGCKASFKSWTEDNLMQKPVLKELLADINSKK
jgi:hypothetical protein